MRDEEIKRGARDFIDGAEWYDNYSKTMTLKIVNRLLDLVAELRDVRNERDGLQIMLDMIKNERKENQASEVAE